jgi:hypothetical protein
VCYERERSRINRLDEMRVHEQDARLILGLALFHLVLYFKISEIHLNFGSMLILVG